MVEIKKHKIQMQIVDTPINFGFGGFIIGFSLFILLWTIIFKLWGLL